MTTDQRFAWSPVLLIALLVTFASSPARADGPLSSGPIRAATGGGVTVPPDSVSGHAVIDTPSLMTATSLRLADVPIMILKDQEIRLRFTLQGVPSRTFRDPTLADPAVTPTTPLLTVDVNALVRRQQP